MNCVTGLKNKLPLNNKNKAYLNFDKTGNKHMQLVLQNCWAQMFEGRLVLNPGLNLTRVSLFCVQKPFFRIIFSVIFRAFNHQLVDKKN